MRTQYTRNCAHCRHPFTTHRPAQRCCSKSCASYLRQPHGKRPTPKQCKQCGQDFLCDAYTPDVEFCTKRCHMRHNALTNRGPAHPLYKPKHEVRCEVCGTVVLVKPSEVDRTRACSRRCAGQLGMRSRPRISSLERRMMAAFQDAGLSPVQQFALGYYAVDFAFPDARLVVECDGTYWHSLPKQQRLDRAKDGYCRSHGWRIIRLPEAAIKADIAGCVQLVTAALVHSDDPLA